MQTKFNDEYPQPDSNWRFRFRGLGGLPRAVPWWPAKAVALLADADEKRNNKHIIHLNRYDLNNSNNSEKSNGLIESLYNFLISLKLNLASTNNSFQSLILTPL